jgi:hypothetical protein
VNKTWGNVPFLGQTAGAELEAFNGKSIAGMPFHKIYNSLIKLHAVCHIFFIDE